MIEIYCYSNEIKKINIINCFPNLEILDCSMNNITHISKNILKSIKLKHICLSNNPIQKLDDDIQIFLNNLNKKKNRI